MRADLARRRAVARAVVRACVHEAAAPKPGNVHPGAGFADLHFADFAASAFALGPVLAHADAAPLGQVILDAVRATRAAVATNTNLGIVLLLAPLARAALAGGPLRAGATAAVAATTVADAADAYTAIRLAGAGGLARVPEQDVAAAPTVPLHAAMALAAPRDRIAAEWAAGFPVTFEEAAPALRRALADGLGWGPAMTEVALAILARHPDTLIARKHGPDAAAGVRAEAQAVVAAGGVRTAAGRGRLAAFDRRLRDPARRLNPGTTADLTAAAAAVVILDA